MATFSGELWPSHPHRYGNELLSSWLTRSAQANGLRVHAFCRMTLGSGAQIWNRDLDRTASQDVLRLLSESTGSSLNELAGGMLSTYEGVLFEHHNPRGNTKWILPLGIYHRTRKRFGLQFCPLCLAEDQQPYYRKQWRLAFHTLCDRHSVMVHDRCPQCEAPVVFFRVELGCRNRLSGTSITQCHQCGFDLSRAPAYGPSSSDAMSLVALRSLVTFHDLGWWFCGQETIHYAPQYFEVLHHLVTFLATGKGARLLAHIERETGWKCVDADSLEKRPFEFRPVGQRHGLLLAALWFLAEWPDRFVTACRQAKLSRTAVTRDEHFPWWYEKVLREYLDRSQYVATTEEAANVAAYLARVGEGVSATKVGNMLGAKDKRSAKAYRKSQRHSIPSGESLQALLVAQNPPFNRKDPRQKPTTVAIGK